MLSQKTKYALKALLYLAVQDADHISKTIEIAESASIPKKFLEQILLDLKRGHFVGSKQGKFGGYYLLKSGNDITLADIHRLFDGAIALLPCASLNFYEPCSDCKTESECSLRHGLMLIRDETLKAMQGITIASLVKK
ncbi:HTH-type transcriptional repressor NsrR [Flavobacterium sp. CECT 9288]|uniref:RrF2 family transcriptional regulator n=1 Tax=Flavobacterium sp. CECT 9288 TaxID=2845819 RepID=UPI001E325C53|nr:Rrf2 family transcriptional regulator [Flavobacterium sp. CECT 9288]CAH0336807.1 HTH-type transcriptional repressor NsrR [Flavobacterium sp. CECT 9288]